MLVVFASRSDQDGRRADLDKTDHNNSNPTA